MFTFTNLILIIIALSHTINGQINTFYRRDYFLSNSIYDENLSDPNIGGRFHIIMAANKKNGQYPAYSKPYTIQMNTMTIKIDPSTNLPDAIDWVYVDYQQSTGQIFVSAHVPNDDLVEQLTLTITDSTGAQMARFLNVNFKHSGLQLYYVTLRMLDENTQQVVMHWYCYYEDAEYDVATLYFNGIQLDSDIPVGPLQHTVTAYNLTTAVQPGDIYTIHVILKDGLQFGWGGRYTNPKQNFSINAIPIDAQCPYPSITNGNYDILTQDLAINSLFISSNTTCGGSTDDILKYYSDNWDGNDLILETSMSSTKDSLSGYNNLDDFASALTVYNNFDLVDFNAQTVNTSITANEVWQQSLKRRLWYPQSMTVCNSFTNHESGTYSGITDYQLNMFLMAGCGDTSLVSTGEFPVTAVYDYYRNARLNHMPEPIWGVVQAFDSWIGGGYLTSSEVTLSFGQAIAAGVNGLLIVGTDVTQQTSDSDAWKAAESLMASIRYLEDKGLMRIASADGAPINAGNSTSLWSALRTIDELIVVAVNINCNGYDPSKCSSTNTPHWTCMSTAVQTVNITVPPDWQQITRLQITVKEIVNGKEETPTFKTSLTNGHANLIFSDVQLDADATTRIFLLST